MAITLRGLMDADIGQLEQTARHWERLAEALDAAVEDLGRDTRELPNHWPAGPSSQAAQAQVADLRVQLGNGNGQCVNVAWTIRKFALTLEDNRRFLHELVAEAESAGLRIDLEAGTITARLTVAAAQSTIDSYAQQIGEVLTRVNEADQLATDRLGQHRYREQYVPDTGRPQFDEVGMLALANITPESQAGWWQAQHPLMQDKAIVEHPQIIGAAVGLPAKDRDSANRLLLQRDKEALLAAREGQERAHDGAMNQAQLNIDRRLAAIDDLERRARGQRLLSYTPGAEDQSEMVRR
ncbi:hypothetical protein JIG36_39650 [Actinoplanes sp. LDG1-06]|uniref:Uncharacterized protein n=1 Tax=Paractinoplanes ovalisporus TaxID=2810368 RepID=A0ABS2AP58_9ACTN|nr:hypothetical protein [Actinoplanes ovalisporus]MBM2621637.1 hypothetical protein [Actinoplanes ovalisporus]